MSSDPSPPPKDQSASPEETTASGASPSGAALPRDAFRIVERIAVPVRVTEPSSGLTPFVFASPHSGAQYPSAFMRAAKVETSLLRASEDFLIDALFADAPRFGAPLVAATFPRVYVDVNREAYELDPHMFADAIPAHANSRSLRVVGGLGTIARVTNDGSEIYRDKLAMAEAEMRIDTFYRPYHRALQRIMDRARERFGVACLVDCHSMPSQLNGPTRWPDRSRTSRVPDVVVGDRFGTSCALELSRIAFDGLRALGLSVVRNTPYAGGFCTEHYGKPQQSAHALQIEINRSLYMDEARMEPLPGFQELRASLARFIRLMTSVAPEVLKARRTDLAAE